MSRHKTPPHMSFVIPVYNAAETIAGLIACLNSITEFETEIVVIDDASTDGSRDIIKAAALAQDNIVPIFNTVNAGAGHGRNIGFASSSGRYTMFLDADDIFHKQAVHVPLRIMEQDQQIDVAVFQYHYTDSPDKQYKGMSHVDEQIFKKILSGSQERTTDIARSPELTRVTNYPWNKIIRSSRYKEIGQLFGSTRVHNDILAHWHILLNARKILTSGSRICTHIVPDRGSNITNISSEKRLELFDALGQTYALLKGFPSLRRPCAIYFWDLAVSLASWAETRIEDDLKPRFHENYKRLIDGMDLEDLLAMRNHGYHGVADRILDAYSWKG